MGRFLFLFCPSSDVCLSCYCCFTFCSLFCVFNHHDLVKISRMADAWYFEYNILHTSTYFVDTMWHFMVRDTVLAQKWHSQWIILFPNLDYASGNLMAGCGLWPWNIFLPASLSHLLLWAILATHKTREVGINLPFGKIWYGFPLTSHGDPQSRSAYQNILEVWDC
jgi:hypothetical protein